MPHVQEDDVLFDRRVMERYVIRDDARTGTKTQVRRRTSRYLDPSMQPSGKAVTYPRLDAIARMTEIQNPVPWSQRIRELMGVYGENAHHAAIECGLFYANKERSACLSNGIDDGTWHVQ